MTAKQLKLVRRDALRQLCFEHHKANAGAGGQSFCACGFNCGGTAACSGLRELLETEQDVEHWRIRVAELEERLRWRPIERFPETIGGVAQWGYVRPQTNEEFESEKPMNFSGYPAFGEVIVDESGHRYAVTATVEARSNDGMIVSARWTWHARSGMPYRWDIAPQNWRIEPRNVDFWRPIED